MAVNDLSGVPWKSRKRKLKRTPVETVTSDAVSFQATGESNAVPGSDFAIVSQSSPSSLPSTPKRGKRQTRQTREAFLTSTPVHSSTDIVSNISKPPGAKQVELQYTELITQLKVFDYILLVNIVSAF